MPSLAKEKELLVPGYYFLILVNSEYPCCWGHTALTFPFLWEIFQFAVSVEIWRKNFVVTLLPSFPPHWCHIGGMENRAHQILRHIGLTGEEVDEPHNNRKCHNNCQPLQDIGDILQQIITDERMRPRPGNNRGTMWELDLRHWIGGIRYPSELNGGSTSHSSHTETTNPQYCWILLHLRISPSLSHSPDQQDPSSHYKYKAEFVSHLWFIDQRGSNAK